MNRFIMQYQSNYDAKEELTGAIAKNVVFSLCHFAYLCG